MLNELNKNINTKIYLYYNNYINKINKIDRCYLNLMGFSFKQNKKRETRKKKLIKI